MLLIDAHAHLTNASFTANDWPPLLERASHAGIEAIINVCTNPEEVEQGLALSKTYPWIYTVASTTPHDAQQEGALYFAQMEHYARSGLLVGVGETGLDYFHYAHTKDAQKSLLRRYLQLAKECKLPIVIHCRDAFADLFEIIDQEYSGFPGMLHCFTGTSEEAQGVIERGWYLSLSGIVTFKKSHALQEVAKQIPLNRLLIETDSPYLAPAQHRGARNEPAYLLETAKFLAALRNIPLQELGLATNHNTRSLFKI